MQSDIMSNSDVRRNILHVASTIFIIYNILQYLITIIRDQIVNM